ncbi:MAG: glycosyltransferase family 2 protein [Hyphomonadaceae bacterium]|nr:glycosyltransferase family 2 protein [Hyphomonadaceae bacterium]
MDSNPSKARSQAVETQVRVSAVVVTRATGQPLELCLRSALAEPWVDELIIVDNGNPRPVGSALRALQADRRDVVLLQGHGDVGLAAGANLGASRARGRWLLFLDPAVVLQRGAVERMAAAGGDARSPWIVGARLTDTRGRDRRSTRRGALTAWSGLAVAMGIGAASAAPRRKEAGEPQEAAAVSGELMLIPRADFEALGGFDEGYAADAADLDLCRRAAEAGGRVLLQPAASGVQFVVERSRAARRQIDGLARFMERSARSPAERAIAFMARPTLSAIVASRKLARAVFGAQPN